MNAIPGWRHPISPARAVGFHFIPFYNLYWIFKWPQPIAEFVNSRLGRSTSESFPKLFMRPQAIGLAVLLALIVRVFIDPGLGLILLFMAASYLSASLRRALAEPAPWQAAAGPPPFV
jgi:hypothetical protein